MDIGITHLLIDTNLNNKSTTEQAFAANKYGDLRERGYNKTIEKKKLDLNAQAMTFDSFGSFGTGTWNVITTACNLDRHPRPLRRQINMTTRQQRSQTTVQYKRNEDNNKGQQRITKNNKRTWKQLLGTLLGTLLSCCLVELNRRQIPGTPKNS